MELEERSREDQLARLLGGIPHKGQGHSCVLSGEMLRGPAGAYLLSRAYRSLKRTVLVALDSEEKAEEFFSDLSFFLGKDDIFFYPPGETLPFELQPRHPDISAARISVLSALAKADKPIVVVTSVSGLIERTMPRDILEAGVIELELGGELSHDKLLERLSGAGYNRVSMIEERGEMSVRGGLLDIFPPSFDMPLRIEFFGDEIESIRLFNPVTQRSVKELLEVTLLPASEVVITPASRRLARERLLDRADHLNARNEAWERLSLALLEGEVPLGVDSLLSLFYEEPATLFDYLAKDSITVVVDPVSVFEEARRLESSVLSAAQRLKNDNGFFVEPKSLFLDEEGLGKAVSSFTNIEMGAYAEGSSEAALTVESNIDLRQDLAVKRGADVAEPLRPLVSRVSGWQDLGYRVFITAHNEGQAERTGELLEGYGLSAGLLKSGDIDIAGEGLSPGLSIAVGTISGGFRLPGVGLVVVSEEELFGRRLKRRPPPKERLNRALAELSGISDGDGLVHAIHGIGLYRGLKRIEVETISSDFMIIEYAGGDNLYLPVDRMEQVSRYHGVEGRAFSPDKLGGGGWQKRTKKVRVSVEHIAAGLLKLYAERAAVKGHAFSASSHLFREFEAGFEFEETPDQAQAIDEVLSDMEAAKPMDRLICGDVGYGKTEVAMRGAFRAVLDNKQVAVLVPTTVLAQQHHLTFTERFAAFPVRVEVLSRFRSKKEQASTVERVKKGEVDILIGTHRLLGKDVEFKDLGLVVIDEEHRFGVKHKERLREISKAVDVLTLTATPIPRTMQMSLAGIRGLSIISSPPEDRLQTKTILSGFNEELIKDAIDRELKRGGQVFFVHNRVESIASIAELLERLIPGARIAIAHGQMKEKELEQKMLGFVAHEFDVLLCTSIIESGLDIPSANTIIINRADRFGLADLYQLRGRVGRSAHRAYAYLLSPELEEGGDARKRLDAIKNLTEAGSGFRVASLDMEIRGAGELLGPSQSGHISEVGLSMYTELLTEAIAELKGEEITKCVEPEVKIELSRYIPEDYLPDTRERLTIYKRIAGIASEDEIDDLAEELLDRYGTVPELVKACLRVAGLKLLLKGVGATELSQRGEKLYLAFTSSASEEVVKRGMKLVKESEGRVRLTPEGRLVYTMRTPAADTDVVKEARYILKELLK